MNRTPLGLLSIALISFAIPLSTSANTALEEIKQYCRSTYDQPSVGDEADELVNECIREQSAYVTETSDPEPVDCYQKVDDYIQEQSQINAEFQGDYERLIDECLNENR